MTTCLAGGARAPDVPFCAPRSRDTRDRTGCGLPAPVHRPLPVASSRTRQPEYQGGPVNLVNIPFNRPTRTGRELEHLVAAIENGHLSGAGPYTHRCQQWLADTLAVPRVFLTTSATHALEMMALLLEIRHGDEVILPSFAFVSLANAFLLFGARPVLADVHEDTLNLDERCVTELITSRTRAVFALHYAGMPCEMKELTEICQSRRIDLLEDLAHGLLAAYGGRALGTFGRMAALSFHQTKILTCGEGGALLLNDESLADRAAVLLEKGTDRFSFLRGEVDKYTWVDIGSSYTPADLLAAFLWAQLEEAEAIQQRRCRCWEYYYRQFRQAAVEKYGARLPGWPAHCRHSAGVFYLLCPSETCREAVKNYLASRGIQATFHYIPLHLSRMGRRLGYKPGDLPVTEDVAGRILRLPLFDGLTTDEQDRVIHGVMTALARGG
ncbi:MAG: dTDP-4-amino-4,6-dideoxygalactose transaminase [Acidobacteria bacterium]|nr:dTDP-4-amino-4,6-dideoxygalactose transaminase [Acidobacteriota bacterium]